MIFEMYAVGCVLMFGIIMKPGFSGEPVAAGLQWYEVLGIVFLYPALAAVMFWKVGREVMKGEQ